MSVKISLVTGQITINDGGSFLLTAADGSIDDRRAQGFFVRDTRLISHYEISIDRQLLTPLTSSNITHRVARYEFTNPELPLFYHSQNSKIVRNYHKCYPESDCERFYC